GFMTRQGRTYRGELEIADGEVQLKRVAGGESADDLGMPEYEVDDSPLGQCPQCKEANVVETRSTFICESGLKVLRALERDDTTLFPVKKKEIPEEMTYCPFLLPRTVCKREITRDEATSFVKDGQTPLLQEFTSRRGRPFVATLHLKENGRHGFEFPPRGEGGGKKKATKKKATKKKATKKKATKKKTTKKTASKKKTTTKKKTAAKKTTAKKTTTKKKTAAKKTAAKKTAAKKADVDPFEPDAPSS
ncbi:MAG: topoisomerase C-terminal repeat-containing protein, partial [Deltaproteobacteria bacterium]